MNIKNTNAPSFKGALNNRYLLSGLKTISEHATSFSAMTSLGMSVGVRTFSILNTPGVEKENKHYAAANSICSGLVKFGIVEAVALPVENWIKKIDNNPKKYLSAAANNVYRNDPAAYKFITQIIKQSTGVLTAIPKSIFTIALIPVVMDVLFPEKPAMKRINPAESDKKHEKMPVKTKHPSFKHSAAEQIGRFLSIKKVLDFALKYQHLDKDIYKHITALTDILLSATSCVQICKNDKIKEKRKMPLIFNNIIPTAATLMFGYGIDKGVQSSTQKFIEKFKAQNLHDPNLAKYIEGINILRPTLIFALIYYGVLPVFSTFLAERTDEAVNKIVDVKHRK